MPSSIEHVLLYAHLSWQAFAKLQIPDADRFLLLAAHNACKIDELEFAELSRNVLLNRSPQHMLKNYEDLCTAYQKEEFAQYFKTVLKFCSFEKGELVLDKIGIDYTYVPSTFKQKIDYAMHLIKSQLSRAT